MVVVFVGVVVVVMNDLVDAEARQPEARRNSQKVQAILIIVVVRQRSRCAGRQRRDRRHRAGLNRDFAAIRIGHGRGAAGAHHDGIAHIGLDPAIDGLEPLPPIELQVALYRLNCRSPGGADKE